MASFAPGPLVDPVRALGGCPSDEQLLALIPGDLAPELASSVTAHLETCVSCQSRLTTLRHRSRTAPLEPTTPPPRLDRRPSDPPAAGPDAPTIYLPQPPLRVPERIGQYKLLKLIGRGGMGLVYLAQHVKLGRTVAIKLLPGLHLSDKSAIVRLQREIAAAGRVQHPNIVFATDANEEDGIDYLVMEYIDGVDIGRLVAVLGPLPCPAACEIIRQAALGLAHIHACGLVHRDLKPSNLMLASDGVVKILDLGLARLREGQPADDDSQTQTGYLLGTADYVSPEQLHDPHDADVRSDLYSLGCTFFKLLAGQAPYSGTDGGSIGKKLDAHRYAAIPSIRSLRPDVPEEVDAVLSRLLAKEPGDRIQQPSELAELLAPLSAGSDLCGLYRPGREQAEIDEPPPPLPLQTPLPDGGSTAVKGRTPTPTRLLAAEPPRKKTWTWISTAAVALCLLAAAGTTGWAIAHLTGLTGIQRKDQPIHGRGPQTFDLSRPLEEIAWEGYESSPPARYNDGQRMLELRSESYQLIKLGDYDGRPGTFEVTIRQTPWHGFAGLFFGYRVQPRRDVPQLASTFQLVWLHHFPLKDGNGRKYGEQMEAMRQRTVLGDDTQPFIREAAIGQRVPLPARAQVRLKVQFGRQGCEKISVDDVVVEDLTAANINQKYDAIDYQGPWGLFSARGYGPKEATWFGNLSFTPLEN